MQDDRGARRTRHNAKFLQEFRALMWAALQSTDPVVEQRQYIPSSNRVRCQVSLRADAKFAPLSRIQPPIRVRHGCRGSRQRLNEIGRKHWFHLK
jgi:hypothetical protein